ncbi:hypothetical protein [Rhodococcus sp. AG1013]|uniref:hypothetical protein n=1 Tax=unclassified Rhodococcus (in: high G+C Gram-positive bacteria) TaxID=192944 RepID=UPI000E0B6362|nr:hypothetical protein [Rhodococcus sp. AG1013]RDI32703.1 hypothetical protein DEU38_103440 [Rhodococcus sp. AG1013]
MSVVADRSPDSAPEPTPAPDSRPERRPASPLASVGAVLRRAGSDTSLALGALSVITFWTFGLGILLGIGAIVTGVAASRAVDVEDDEPKSLEALFGALSGALGVTVGVVFLVVAGPQW